jgi:hypothetical protein
MQLARAEMRDSFAKEFETYKREFNKKFWVRGTLFAAMTVAGLLTAGMNYIGWERKLNAYLAEQEVKVKQRIDNTLTGAVAAVNQKADEAMKNSVDSVRKKVDSRIDEEFRTARIQGTVTNAAEKQARSILAQRVTPEVDKMRTDIASRRREFDSFLHSYEGRYKGDYEALSRTTGESTKLTQTMRQQVDLLTRRNNVQQLTDSAMADGDRNALQVLSIMSQDTALDGTSRQLALSGLLQAKRFWIDTYRYRGTEIAWTGVDGKSKKEGELNACDLMLNLAKNNSWIVRAKAAELLAVHRKESVPDALLTAIRSDAHLQVVSRAVVSFQEITAYVSPDVFGEPYTSRWWDDHAAEKAKELQKLDCVPAK